MHQDSDVPQYDPPTVSVLGSVADLTQMPPHKKGDKHDGMHYHHDHMSGGS
ncbi:MAG TPA: lasso RiPP family leader peptide-containing protein [Acidimicrobiales bacterium]|nr:lasso RiPP family leader peptide-containing protein [Acidimicrobiales bacterium]